MDFIQDKNFLLRLDNERNKRIFVKITVLDNDEIPIEDIEGRITSGGSINIDGNSAMRRSANISFVAEEADNDLENIDNLLSLNKKIELSIGVENNIDNRYDKIIWFKQGIYIITSPSLNHSSSSVTINLNLKDKMCKLNGESGGYLPTSVTFDSYDQIIGQTEKVIEYRGTEVPFPVQKNNYTIYIFKNLETGEKEYYQWDDESGWSLSGADIIGTSISIKQLFYDIIKTSVINYGMESADNIIIEDVPLENKQIVHWVGGTNL